MKEKEEVQNKSNIIKTIIFFIIVICIASVFSGYLINDEFRKNVNSKFLNKEITEDSSSIIEINTDSEPNICAFDKYIAILSKNVLTFYNQDADKISETNISVTIPKFAYSNKYLAIAENKGNKLYLFNNTEERWEKELDGEIYRINVNKNGYVSVLLNNTTYKSIIVVYDFEGNELFRTYLANNYAICSDVSENNKYLAVGEIDYSGTIVKSVVKIIDIDLVKNDSQNSIIYTYESESNKILNNITFNNKNEAICMFDSYIQKIKTDSDERVYDITKDDIFVDINLNNNIVAIQKETTGLFSYKYQTTIKSTIGKSDNLYILENDIPKKLKVTNSLICINLVNEVRIVNSSGWLLKKYVTNSEIQDIVVGDSIIGIVYNNKIEVINI